MADFKLPTNLREVPSVTTDGTKAIIQVVSELKMPSYRYQTPEHGHGSLPYKITDGPRSPDG